MSTKKSPVIQPLRIALLCASALMLSTAFAEDGSNVSGIQYHPGTDNTVTTSSQSVTPADQDGDSGNLSAIQYHPEKDNGPVVNSGMDASVVPADHNGYISEVREIQYHPGNDGGRLSNTSEDRSVIPADLDGDGSSLAEIQYHPPVEPQSYVYTIDNAAYFGFNQAVLTPKAKSELNRMVAKMDQADNIRSITITGHADTIGATPYNRALAFRRADAVKTYLISRGISADRITTQSDGSASPLVSCNADKKLSDKINCLAPDRRADVNALLASHPSGMFDNGNIHS
ncbi:MAG: OmpA family protein [Candidatus Thiodiazotropha sp.]